MLLVLGDLEEAVDPLGEAEERVRAERVELVRTLGGEAVDADVGPVAHGAGTLRPEVLMTWRRQLVPSRPLRLFSGRDIHLVSVQNAGGILTPDHEQSPVHDAGGGHPSVRWKVLPFQPYVGSRVIFLGD